MMARRILAATFLIVIVSLGSAEGATEPYLTEAQRTRQSDAVFDGLVEQITEIGVVDEYRTLWEATVLLKSVVKGRSLRQETRVKVYFTGPNGQKMIVCPSPPRIERNLKARFYASRREILELKRVLFIQSDQWVVRKDAI